MNYTLHQLQVFLKVSETKSITKAAEELYLTQPAVSIQLKNFQEQFDIPLTEVVGRQLYVTEFGQEIARAAENILNEVHAINYKTMAFKGKLTGKLKITSVSTGKYVIPYLLADFMKLHSEVELMLDVTNKNRVIHSLERNEIDFALVSVVPEMNIQSIPLMENQLVLVANRSFKKPKRPLSLDEIQQLPLIYRELGSGSRHMMERFLENQNITITKKIELTSNEAVKQAIIAGLGCSIMPIIGIKNELYNGDLQIIPAEGLPQFSQWNLIWLKSKNLSPTAEAFKNYLLENKSEIIATHFGWASTL
ncbi:LysR family transcriptional regulator [Flavobacterium sp.]|uniref:LysR family transcriptional regulator n=1 Tax=Flavobacterium sp. TaxID=239 RepID=UPI002623DE6D|nr:LysR family transcriptional regulator [Flavobacterium sp.]